MKICFYSPYLPDHFGGGEKYFFDTATVLNQKHQVYIAITDQPNLNLSNIQEKYADRFGQGVHKFQFITTPLGTCAKAFKKLLWTAKFDAIYYVTDGSLFFSLARKNILHLQIPFTSGKTKRLERLKLSNWRYKNTNSFFTKRIIEKYWQVKINDVIQPGIDLKFYHDKGIHKEKIILNVGRFFTHLHSKKQDKLVEFFRELRRRYPEKMTGWQLVLIGPAEDQHYAQTVAHLAADLPVTIIHQINNEELQNWYKRASIYWHATGYGLNEEENPEKMEHFWISTVEAMAAGAVPIVIGSGGQPEILGRRLKDCLWITREDCLRKTIAIITKPRVRLTCQQAARERAKKFSSQNFEKKIWQMLKNGKK